MKISLLQIQKFWHLVVGAALVFIMGVVLGLYLFAKYFDTPEVQVVIEKIKTRGKSNTEIVIPVQPIQQDTIKKKKKLIIFNRK